MVYIKHEDFSLCLKKIAKLFSRVHLKIRNWAKSKNYWLLKNRSQIMWRRKTSKIWISFNLFLYKGNQSKSDFRSNLKRNNSKLIDSWLNSLWSLILLKSLYIRSYLIRHSFSLFELNTFLRNKLMTVFLQRSRKSFLFALLCFHDWW